MNYKVERLTLYRLHIIIKVIAFYVISTRNFIQLFSSSLFLTTLCFFVIISYLAKHTQNGIQELSIIYNIKNPKMSHFLRYLSIHVKEEKILVYFAFMNSCFDSLSCCSFLCFILKFSRFFEIVYLPLSTPHRTSSHEL